MKFTWNWLLDHLDTGHSPDVIARALTSLGVEVESFEDYRSSFDGYEIVQIQSLQKHPNASRLYVCQIHTSQGVQQVVCGAPNVIEGAFAIWASPGSTLPRSNIKIQERYIRDEYSYGMLCSLEELGIEEHSVGIYLLDDTQKAASNTFIGQSITHVLKDLFDPIFEVSLTPNRVDCASVFGIARLLSAGGFGTLKQKNILLCDSAVASPITINLHLHNAQIAACVIKGITKKESPSWLKYRLRAIGIQPISSIIDIITYILFDQNYPLHAFDIHKLSSYDLSVRELQDTCVFYPKVGDSCALYAGDVVISDQEGPIALAGIIDGKRAEITEDTTDLLIIFSLFNQKHIFQTNNRLMWHNDYTYRFERGLDPCIAWPGLHFSIQLITNICGGIACKTIYNNLLSRKERRFCLSKLAFDSLVGPGHLWSELIQSLARLDYRIYEHSGEAIEVIPPSYRMDVDTECVLIEDYMRLKGIRCLKNVPLPCRKTTSAKTFDQVLVLKKCFSSRGFIEHYGFTFSSRVWCSSPEDLIMIKNPINCELSYMRQTLIYSLFQAAINNWKKGITNIRLFEVGPIFKNSFINKQKESMAAILMGDPIACWKNHSTYDVYDLKAELLNLLKWILGQTIEVDLVSGTLPPYYHPTRSIRIIFQDIIIGFIGQLHPSFLRDCKIATQAFIFELFLDDIPHVLFEKGRLQKKSLHNIQRDFCFVVNQSIPAGDIKKIIQKASGSNLQSIMVFDVFNMDHEQKSLAFRVSFGKEGKTFTAQEIDLISNKIIVSVEKSGGLLRRE